MLAERTVNMKDSLVTRLLRLVPVIVKDSLC